MLTSHAMPPQSTLGPGGSPLVVAVTSGLLVVDVATVSEVEVVAAWSVVTLEFVCPPTLEAVSVVELELVDVPPIDEVDEELLLEVVALVAPPSPAPPSELPPNTPSQSGAQAQIVRVMKPSPSRRLNSVRGMAGSFP
jgi:hypothetical protein